MSAEIPPDEERALEWPREEILPALERARQGEGIVVDEQRLLALKEEIRIRAQLRPAIERLDRGEGIILVSDEALARFFKELMEEED